MQQVTCVLRVLDTEITIDERIDAWRAAGGSATEAEKMRYKAAMFVRTPVNVSKGDVKCLDLGKAGFKRVVDLASDFSNLTHLLLRHNQLTTIEGSGIRHLSFLTVLDLRDNQLSSMDEIVNVIRHCNQLASIGIAGNKFSKRSASAKDNTSWRMKFLRMIPELHERYCALRAVDNRSITVDEIIKAWKDAPSKNPTKLYFKVLMVRVLPKDGDPSRLTTLDISSSNLYHLDLSHFSNLQTLSMSHNNLKTMEGLGIEKLIHLEALDISNNKFSNIGGCAKVLGSLPRLHTLIIFNNPCFKQDSTTNRQNLLTKMFNYFDPHNIPLTMMNGVEVTVCELCDSLKRMVDKGKGGGGGGGGGTGYDVEQIRLDLACKRLMGGEVNLEKTSTTYLDLQGLGFSSIYGVRQFSALTHLNLRGNRMKKMEKEVYSALSMLFYLDLRDNQFSSIRDVIDGLRQGTPSLSILFLHHCTKGKDSATPRKYLKKVCKGIRRLDTCDSLKNPFGRQTIGKNTITNTIGRKHALNVFKTVDTTPLPITTQNTIPLSQSQNNDKSTGKGFYNGYNLSALAEASCFAGDWEDEESEEYSSSENY